MMSKISMEHSLNQLKVLIVVAIMILIGQRIGYGIPIMDAIPGMLIVVGLAMFALILKESFPEIKFPAFAYASLAALILSMPFMPTS